MHGFSKGIFNMKNEYSKIRTHKNSIYSVYSYKRDASYALISFFGAIACVAYLIAKGC